MQLLVEALFIIIKNYKQPRCPSIGEQTVVPLCNVIKGMKQATTSQMHYANEVARPKRLQTI